MFAGMGNANGDLIFTSDSDLEEPPENLVDFYSRVKQNPGIDILYAVVRKRDGGIVRNFFGSLFYKFMRWGTDVQIPENMSWQIMMTRSYVNALMLYNEAETLPAGLMMLAGFNHDSILIDKTYKGSTSYTFSKRLKLAFNSITAFSSKPLIFISIIGISITFLSFIGIIIAIILKLFFINYRSGWVSLLLSIWFMGGLILSSVGIIGIYMAKIFNQVKGRPLYIIKTIIMQNDQNEIH